MIIFPVVGAIFLSIVRFKNDSLSVKIIPLFICSIVLVLNIVLLLKFNYDKSGFQFTQQLIDNLAVGLDGISIVFVSLTTFLFFICSIFILDSKFQKLQPFLSLFLLLEGLIICVFVSLNIIMFYVFFEAVLIPIFFIIGIWGHQDKVYAAFKLFLYTLFGSLLFLVAIIYIYVFTDGVTSIEKLSVILSHKLTINEQKWLWLAFFSSFSIKIPMIPFHTWLPNAHVQAPTIGSVILAGILIKIGGYGFLRFSLPMLPEASIYFSKFIVILSIIALIYTSLIAFAQKNIKKLIAYSSIAHMSFMTAGIFSFSEYGILGSIFQMVSHGLISSALFLSVGMIYDRAHTLDIDKYGGLALSMPKFSFMFIIFSMASVGIPGTSGFIGEFLSILGIFQSLRFVTAFFAIGIILSAVYMLYLCKKIIWGQHSNVMINDITKIELTLLSFLAIFIVFLGLCPHVVLDYLRLPVQQLLVDKFF
ncbi:proton-translocating NADH-quinone oxidoreductase, chain M family protein [Candidatus Neoehrlichia lotoris str. RAC413]|uniref:NADH-quinone oxidoreductase subunit M n=2 Tax=Candidatus Neoehrlichia procyonis TaxID=467750 RepID=A0A0F3NLH6_9RICK|nr:NADH-quinone oxidoreductase subunit M [Candidatus Neoehrlichia lotoris]KJV68923.1 proton-translocating NADH-quinone oxidoreductase, chain M family protein [Candidatus Neoehrlichia lotoris str. RAC413]